jgi:hypothetical protein
MVRVESQNVKPFKIRIFCELQSQLVGLNLDREELQIQELELVQHHFQD